MTKRYSTAYFIEKAIARHGNRFDYSLVDYKLSTTPVIIICPKHGEFSQTPVVHLSGSKCKQCAGTRAISTKEFIKRARKVHGDKYCYKKTDYQTTRKEVLIGCNTCGDVFSQKATYHMAGNGCQACGGNIPLDINEFIRRSKEHHGDFYSYKKSVYKSVHSKITIDCPVHGEFEQTAQYHMTGARCLECAFHGTRWSKSGYEKTCERYAGLSELYIIKCTIGDEQFYKIGITAKGLHVRHSQMVYDYEPVKSVVGDAGFIWDLEHRLHNLNSHNRYKPSVSFAGETECFTTIPKEILKLIDEMNNTKQLQLIA